MVISDSRREIHILPFLITEKIFTPISNKIFYYNKNNKN